MIKKYLISNQIKSVLLNSIGFVIQFAIVFVIGLTFASYFASNKYLMIVAVLWTLGLIVIGLIYKYRGWHDEYQTIESPWEMGNFGSKLMAQEVIFAFIVNEIVMGAAGCIYRIITALKLIFEIRAVENSQIMLVLQYLLKLANEGKRFNNLKGMELDINVLGRLISCGAVWTKIVDGNYMVGINRDYEKIIKSEIG